MTGFGIVVGILCWVCTVVFGWIAWSLPGWFRAEAGGIGFILGVIVSLLIILPFIIWTAIMGLVTISMD